MYTSLDEVVAREELALFAGTTGSNCGVAARYDTEAMKTTGLANLLRAERDAPRADVFWSSEQFQMSALASEGVLARLPDALLANWPKPWQDTNGRWIALNARARVLCFDSRKVDALGAPQLWSAFAAVEYPAGIVIADPRFGSTRGHFAAMRQVYEHAEPGLFARMLAGLKRSHTRLLPGGNAAVVDAVLRGEAQFGFTDTDDVITAMQAGKPIGFTLPRHFNEGIAGGGTLLIPSTLGIIEGTARRACAEQCVQKSVRHNPRSTRCHSATAFATDPRGAKTIHCDSILLQQSPTPTRLPRKCTMHLRVTHEVAACSRRTVLHWTHHRCNDRVACACDVFL